MINKTSLKYTYLYILIICFVCSKAQTRFNINVSIGVDTSLDAGIKAIQLKNKQYISCGVVIGAMINYQAAYIVKTDSMGNCIWRRQYDFSPATTFTNNGTDIFRDVIELPDSNYLLLGTTTNTLTNDDDAFLCKIDTAGNVIWLKKYMHPDDDECSAFKITPDGKIIIVGYTFSNGGTHDDVVLIKTDINGNLIWRKRFGHAIYWEKYYTIDVIKNNTEYILGGEYGYYNTGNPYFDMSIMRTDTAGNALWQQQYGIASIDDTGKGGIPTLDSGYVIYGQYNGEESLLKVDKYGVQQWVKNYGYNNNAIISQVIQLPDSNYVLMLATSDTETMSFTGRLVKTDKNGDVIWKRIYSPYNTCCGNYFYGFNTTADKGFIITGEYGNIGQPYQNTWLVKTDSLGCDSASGCSYLTTGLVSSSVPDSYRDKNQFSVYPNPTNNRLSLTLSEGEGTALGVIEVKITNMLGAVVLSSPLRRDRSGAFDVSFLQQGIYFLSVYKGAELLGVKKIIKE